ncbi:unnamed protein product [Auanema sp. JU1783]|nr:unnamed protein product [Auanema sp. JU1783]
MQAISRSVSAELDVGMTSSYEDALDVSDSELEKLCQDAARHLKREKPQTEGIILTPIVRAYSAKHKRSSSSENSSIEKIRVEGARSRVTTMRERDRTRRAANRSGSSQSDEDWRTVNYAFQEVAHYPVLVQINQQLQLLSRQLYDIESTNTLQLRIIAHMLGKLIQSKKSSFFSFSRLIRSIPILLCFLIWPFVAKTVFMWIMKRPRSFSFFRLL